MTYAMEYNNKESVNNYIRI